MMMFSLPSWPFLPAWLHRRPVEPKPEPWPGNVETLAADLAESLANEGQLVMQLRRARQEADPTESARLVRQAERRAAHAEAEHERTADELTAVHRENRDLRKQLAAVQRQLDDALYDEAAIDAIESGTGEPTHS